MAGGRRARLQLPPALRSPGFRRLWISGMVSSVGTQAGVAGTGWVLYRLTGSASSLGVSGLAFAIPITVVPLLAGAVVDRLDARRLLLILLAAEAATALGLGILAVEGMLRPGWLYLASVIDAVRLSFAIPAQSRMLPASVTAEALPSAQSLAAMIWPATALAGPMVAGALLTVAGAPLLYGGNAALTAMALLVLVSRSLPTPPAGRGAPLRGGLAWLVTARWPVTLLGVVAAVAALVVGTESLLPVIAVARLHTGVAGYTVLRTGAGLSALLAGGTLASLRSARSPSPTGPAGAVRTVGLLALVGIGAFALLTAPLGLAGSTLVIMLGSTAGTVIPIVVLTRLQLSLPPRFRGSLGGLAAIAQSGVAGLAAAAMGLAAGHLDLRVVLLTADGVAALVVTAGLAATRAWSLRGARD